MRACVDGCLVKALIKGGPPQFLLVKGYNHPLNRFVVFPYKEYKLYKIKKKFIPCIGREAYIISHSDVHLEFFWPDVMLKNRLPDLDPRVEEFISVIDPEWVGLTGSWALWMESLKSDVDLVLFSSDYHMILNKLYKLKNKGYIYQCDYINIINKRKNKNDVGIDINHIESSLTETCYKGLHLTLRLLRKIEMNYCNINEFKRYPLGMVSFTGLLEPLTPGEEYLVPAKYKFIINNKLFNNKVIVESWRTRYQGLREGVYLVQGEAFLESDNSVTVSPDLMGGIWRVE